MAYDLNDSTVPRMAGTPLKLVTRFAESPFGGLLTGTLLKNVGIPKLRASEVGDAPMAPRPVLGAPRNPNPPAPDLDALVDHVTETHGDFRFESVADIRAAYKDGRTNPVEVAERAIAAIAEGEDQSPPMRTFFASHTDDVMKQARASQERWAKGAPCGPLDGIPIAIKDEVNVAGYPTTVGTRFMADWHGVAKEDCTGAARLRASGGVLLGKANMTEIGIGPIGLQAHHGTARNPYNTAHFTGGSSAGPGAAVAAGLCPISLGADGGGSIRTPAAMCGVVGLKATFGRVSEHGVPPVCWSVAHLGPLAANARDCALAYATVAGADGRDPLTDAQPTPDLEGLDNEDLSDVTLGVYSDWFDHADPNVVRECRKMLAHLESKGAHVKEIEIPDLDLLRIVHAVTIGTEMYAAQAPYLAKHRKDFSTDVRLLFASFDAFRATDYVHAQRQRHIICERFARLLDEVDVIVSPTNGCTAPPIPEGALDGESNIPLLFKVLRFVNPANLTGLPAISFPAGYDDSGLPVGFQAVGRPYEESLLLRLAAASEDGCPRQKPGRWHSLLG